MKHIGGWLVCVFVHLLSTLYSHLYFESKFVEKVSLIHETYVSFRVFSRVTVFHNLSRLNTDV